MSINGEVTLSKKVLFVDDEIEILNSIKRQISLSSEFEGIYISNPAEVMNTLKKYRIEIIVADIVMPELDGITLLKEIKANYPQIIRILLTAHGDYNTSMRAIKEADVFGFITKPWDKNYLFGHLKMAAKAYDRMNKEQKPATGQKSITTMISYWDDKIGSEILSYSPSNININLEDIASRCFMSSSGFYGYTYRFDKTLISLPLNDINMHTRLYLDKNDEKPFGVFVIAPSIPKEIESDIDNILQKCGKSFCSGSSVDGIVKNLEEDVKTLFKEKIE